MSCAGGISRVVLRRSAHDGALHEEGVARDLDELNEVVVVVGGVELEEARVDGADEHLDALLHQRLHEAQPQVHLRRLLISLGEELSSFSCDFLEHEG